MSTNTRGDIFVRLRAALGRTAAEAAIAARNAGPRPLPDTDAVARFRRESTRMSSTVDEVATLAEVPAAVARYLGDSGLARSGVVWPSLAGLDWAGAGLAMEARAACDADLVGVTGCFCAIAETGTLMTCSGPRTPAATSLLPETHVAVVPTSRIVAGMEEAWALARRELGELPRAVNFISGPSRTGDIELTIVLGVHGPYRVHLVLVRDE